MPVRRTRKDDGSQWTAADSRSVYGIRNWGAGYFAISDAGRVEVRPNGECHRRCGCPRLSIGCRHLYVCVVRASWSPRKKQWLSPGGNSRLTSRNDYSWRMDPVARIKFRKVAFSRRISSCESRVQ